MSDDKETITPERYVELANEAMKNSMFWQPGMEISLGERLANGGFALVYESDGAERMMNKKIRFELGEKYRVEPAVLF